MNRRRAPSAARRKRPRRKPIRSEAAKKTSKAAKRPRRKNAPKKAGSAKTAVRKAPVKRAPPKGSSRGKPARKRAQNRRRPVAKKVGRAEARPTLRARATALRGSLGGWVVRYRAGLRRMGQAVIASFVGAAVLWVGGRTVAYARSADAFAIDEIIIAGNAQLEDIDVRRAAGVQVGSNIFEISAEEARNHLLKHPWIEDATVVRRLPSKVRVDVVERRPVALVALDHLYLVSDQGAVFKRLGVDDPVDLPVITGIASERFYDDLDYRTEVLLGSMALLQDYESAGLAEREPVSEIHFDGANGLELFVGSDGMNVRLGNGQHRQKLRRLRRVLERLAREKTRPSYVYLDNVRSPERVTVRIP